MPGTVDRLIQPKGADVTEGHHPPPGATPDCESPLAFALAERDRDTISLVRRALERKTVTLAFQPIVQARDASRIAFYKGLLRVGDDTVRLIPARDFITTIETSETGRIVDCLALEMGLAALRDNPGLRLAVNMSDLVSVFSASSWHSCSNMAQLQQRSVAFALGDLGAGYEAIRYFKDFFLDIMKIDGQFIQGIHKDPDNRVLTQALISIAQHFDMFTVAELVEDPKDAAFLRQAGIDCMQVYAGLSLRRPAHRAELVQTGPRPIGQRLTGAPPTRKPYIIFRA